MKDILHALHTSPHESPVADGADLRRKWRRKDVEADDLMFQVSQSADKSLTEVTCAACNQNSHTRLPRRQSNPDNPSFRARRVGNPTAPSSFQTISNPDRRTSGQYRRSHGQKPRDLPVFWQPPEEGVEHKRKYRDRKADKTATRPYQIVVAKYRDEIKAAKYASRG
jgi:hypothetical protein